MRFFRVMGFKKYKMGKRDKKNRIKNSLLATGFVLVVLVGVLSPVADIGAQTSPPPSEPLGTCTTVGVETFFITQETRTRCEKFGGRWAPGSNPMAPLVTNPQTGASVVPPEGGGCGLLDLKGCIVKLFQIIFIGILTFLSFFLWLAGQLLNFVLDYTIVGMKTQLDKMTGINTGWKIVRDLMNIVFIFLLVYEGIKLIIGLTSRENIKKFIGGIVLASLLINFSLFFTKVLIDASNVVTIGIYNQILGPIAGQVSQVTNLQYGLSEPIVKNLGLSSVYSQKANPNFGGNSGVGGIIVQGFGSGILIIVAAFVFFAVAIMFIIRYLVLILLLILSHVAYMGMALPSMKGHAKEWWTSLNGQLLFPPIYMILTYLVLKLMESTAFTRNGNFSELFDTTKVPGTTAVSNIALLVNFALLIGLLIASLVIAKNTATKGSKFIGKATGKFTAFAGGAVMGSAASAGRKTIGRWGANQANNEELKEKIAKGEASRMERLRFAAGTRAATATYDARRSRIGESVAKQTGVDFGKGTIFYEKAGQGGFKKEDEERIKRELKYAESLKPSDTYIERLKQEAEGKTGAEVKAKENEHLQKEVEVNKSREKIVDLEKEAEEKRKSLDNEMTMEEEMRIRQEITGIQDQIKSENQNLDKLKKVAVDAEKASEATNKKHKEIIKGIEETYVNRIEAYAQRVEQKGVISRYGSTLARIAGGAVVGGAVAGPVGAVIGGANQVATAPGLPSINKSELASKIRALKKKKKDLTPDEKKKYKKTIKNPESTQEEKAEAWEKLGIESDGDEEEAPTPKPEPPKTT